MASQTQGRIAVLHRGPTARLHDDVFALLVETRDYLTENHTRHIPDPTWVSVAESMRLTTRIIDMMAWVLAHKAVEHGEIDLDTCRQKYALEAMPVHLMPVNDTDRGRLPQGLTALLDRSLGLYQRIARLDGKEVVQR